jgi:hypothetical protein
MITMLNQMQQLDLLFSKKMFGNAVNQQVTNLLQIMKPVLLQQNLILGERPVDLIVL